MKITGNKKSSLLKIVRQCAGDYGNDPAFTYSVDGKTNPQTLDFATLDYRAKLVGAWLQSVGASGKPVILMYPPGLEFIMGFLACVYAGAVAIPIMPPRLNRSIELFRGIVADARPEIALTHTSARADVERLKELDLGFQHPKWMDADDVPDGIEQEWCQPEVSQNSVCYLQYTSGSTATPKGVMITHDNLLSNCAMIARSMSLDKSSVIINWLPHYHDMGLVGGFLVSLWLGAHSISMSPMVAMQRPIRWLQLISRFKGTVSGGPNFAYNLCVQEITSDQCAAINLNSWEVAFVGAEPIHGVTLRRFATAFASCGFRMKSFFPCYGLAEATLMVSGGSRLCGPKVATIDRLNSTHVGNISDLPHRHGDREIVSCGTGVLGETVKIVDTETLRECATKEVGEIWVNGPNIAKGYWKRERQTREVFSAQLSDNREECFLRTGDLGFFYDGELFITGRLKDLIIINGVNYHPQDVELTVSESHSTLHKGLTAAFSIEVYGGERLVILKEVRSRDQKRLHDTVDLIRASVTAHHGLRPYCIALLPFAIIPRTSSGKLRRLECRALFLSGRLHTRFEWREPEHDCSFEGERRSGKVSPSTQGSEAGNLVESRNLTNQSSFESEDILDRERALEILLREQVSQSLKIPASEIDLNASLVSLGVDSILAMKIVNEFQNITGLIFPLELLFNSHSLCQIAAEIAKTFTDVEANEDLNAIADVVRLVDEMSDEEVDTVLREI